MTLEKVALEMGNIQDDAPGPNQEPSPSSSKSSLTPGGGRGRGRGRPVVPKFPCGRLRSYKIDLGNGWNWSIAQEQEAARGNFVREDSRKAMMLKQRFDVGQIFNMRTCKHFIPNPKDESKCQCNRQRKDHDESEPFSDAAVDVKWNSKDHTKEIPTQTYGMMEFTDFTGSRKKSAKFLRVSNTTQPSDLYNVMSKRWNVRDPNIIISVTGGALDFHMDPELSIQFKKGLVKSAADTGAWIVTGGTNTGVMAYVGAAMAEQPHKNKERLAVIGIVPWGIIYKKENLEGCKGNKISYTLPPSGTPGIAVNPDHTHFFMVDDGSENMFGTEIDLRSVFERYVSTHVGSEEHEALGTSQKRLSQVSNEMKKSSCKIVCVLLEGGPNSAETLYTNLVNGVPCVVAENSGRAADIISYAQKNHRYQRDEDTGRLMGHFDPPVRIKLENDMLNAYGWNSPRFTEEERRKNLDKQMKYLKEFCAKDNERFMTIYSITDPYNNDLDKAILGALIKAIQSGDGKTTVADLRDQLYFAVKWNRPDTAEKNIFNKNRQGMFDQKFLSELFMECMLENKHEFVKLLLKNGVSIDMFKNVAVLEQLFIYKNHENETFEQFVSSIVLQRTKNKPFFLAMMQGLKHLISGGFTSSLLTAKFENNYSTYYAARMVEESKATIEGRELPFDKVLECNPPELADPSFIMFVWAILMNYHDMAKVLWRYGDNYIAKALIAMRMYTNMGEMLGNIDSDDLEEHTADFAEMALEMLQKCHKTNETDCNQMIVSSLSNCSSHSILGLAVMSEHEEFIAHPSSQMVVDEMWSGGIKQCEGLTVKALICVLFPPLACWLFEFDDLGNIFETSPKDDSEDNNKDNAIRITSMSYRQDSVDEDDKRNYSCFQKYYLFYTAPVTKFWLNTIFFYMFLLLFTFFVLGELPPKNRIPYLEIYLAMFVLSITTEEIRQVLTESGKLSKKLKEYFTSIWNWLDAFGIILFWIGFGMRFSDDQTMRNIARLFYILDVFFWFMRVLNVLTISQRLGPLVAIILKMIPDVLRFFWIWFLFMIAFGVITKSVSTPRKFKEVTWRDVVNVIDMSYWQTYGELFLEDLQADADLVEGINCTWEFDEESDLPPCPFAAHSSILFLAVYMVIGNILLMNLLIAIFSSVYEEVNSKALTYWKNKRLDVIVEFHTRPPLPPPFTVFYHLFLLTRWSAHILDVKASKGLTLKITSERLNELLLFEEEVKEEYLIDLSYRANVDLSQQLRFMQEKMEDSIKRMNDHVCNLETESKNTSAQLQDIKDMLLALTQSKSEESS